MKTCTQYSVNEFALAGHIVKNIAQEREPFLIIHVIPGGRPFTHAAEDGGQAAVNTLMYG